MKHKITPFLWFNNNAEEAVNYYTSVFKNSKITSIAKYSDEVPNMAGKVMMAVFEIEGQQFMAIDGGAEFKFTEAISLFVDCKNQAEVDYFWEKLSLGGEKGRCGWLKDKFGLSWQIIPTELGQLLGGSYPNKSQKVMQAMLKMDKIDITTLKNAYN